MAAPMIRAAAILRPAVLHVRLFSTTSQKCDKKWKEKHGLPVNPNSYGPLVDLPDYSFTDGRPTPLSSGQRRKRERQVGYSEKIMELLNEIDVTKRTYNEKMSAKQTETDSIMRSKLKPKGNIKAKMKS